VRHRRFYDAADLESQLNSLSYLAEPVALLIAAHGSAGVLMADGEAVPAETFAALRNAPNVFLLHFSACEMMVGTLADQIHGQLVPGHSLLGRPRRGRVAAGRGHVPLLAVTSDFEALGGEAGLRPLVSDFIRRVYADAIIGFFFVGIDRERLVQRELELAAAHLGGPQAYSGRPVGTVHRPHPINPGHFHRRLWLLEKTLRQHGVDEGIITRWLEHDRRLERAVVSAPDCLPSAPAARDPTR
jgi:hemoglobin